MKPKTIDRWGRWVRWHTPVLAWPFRRLGVKLLAYWRSDPATIRHLIAALDSMDSRVNQTATRALCDLSDYQDCVDVLLQISAARGALSKSGQVLLKSHIETCVSDAFASGGPEASRQQVTELMEDFDRFGGLAAR